MYKALFNFDDAAAQRKGLDRVDTWKSRSAGKLPLAIDCTAYLISAELSLKNVTCSLQRKLILVRAIVRFVNVMTDQEQKGLFGRSVQLLAAEIGLPDWLVELRYEATHARLPSLESLKCGLYEGLKWLKTEYWEAQSILHDRNKEKLLQLLIHYKLTPYVYLHDREHCQQCALVIFGETIRKRVLYSSHDVVKSVVNRTVK